ncbi:RILP-like protein 2 isoform X2 [Nycticebus coucang]|uniref:RILP-like protein 2 isoform X2 n=1 Tax=Nycticebus coucang TaxID=9470 RepID=UPI00234C380B|nr:RILP-like protein 2 isoform X2 [Nycticebus coucang]
MYNANSVAGKLEYGKEKVVSFSSSSSDDFVETLLASPPTLASPAAVTRGRSSARLLLPGFASAPGWERSPPAELLCFSSPLPFAPKVTSWSPLPGEIISWDRAPCAAPLSPGPTTRPCTLGRQRHCPAESFWCREEVEPSETQRKQPRRLRWVWVAMEEPPLREEEEGEEEEEDQERDEAGPEGALGKSPFQLTAEDVYDISYVMGRELMALGSDPRVTQLQFKIVRVLEMLEALVSEGNLAVEELRMERDSLRKEVEGLRRVGPPDSASGEVNLGPDKAVVDLTDPNRPRFTLQELRDVLQERNRLKSQLLVAQEELQCYKRFFFRSGKQT